MPKLIIDDQEIEVPQGTKVIDAAERLGIMIPRFCFHPALGSVGACRVCAVKFLQGPFKGVQMSCMIDAADDMVVSTTDEEAVDFRKHVIEWLMLNHPHDCPVCDEGGHCLLQDMTVSGGHGIRRYRGKKRTHNDQYLGPLIQHEMNRCIQCYRCSRYYQEFTGYRDLGVMQIGSRVYFGRYKPGTLESPFSGNLSDVCPTGVYTDKPSRYKGRRWDFARSPSICLSCSLGCHITVSTRYREVVRQEANFSEAVNGYFICDRGRYGFYYAIQNERPRRATIDGEPASWRQSLQTAAERLSRISTESGPDTVACVGSVRSSLETLAALRHLCRTRGWPDPAHWLDHRIEKNIRTAVSRLERTLAVSLRDIEKADYILALGTDPVNEAPMLAMAMRQAKRRGAEVAIVDPRPIDLPFDFDHLPVSPRFMDLWLALLMNEIADPEIRNTIAPNAHDFFGAIPPENNTALLNRDSISVVLKNLQQSRRPVIVCGTEVVSETVPGLAADCARLLKAMDKSAGLFFLLSGANAFGAALLSNRSASFETILTGIESGNIKALVLVESDPYRHFPDRQRLERALQRLDLLIVFDYLDSRGTGNPDIFVPTLTLYEAGGLFINQEGRVQRATAAYRGGQPITQISDGNHPPRQFGSEIPGGEAQTAWQALAELSEAPSEETREEMHTGLLAGLADAHPVFSVLPTLDAFPRDGILLDTGPDATQPVDREMQVLHFPESGPAGGLELILAEWTFGTEELSACSPCLRKMEKAPCITMHIDDAKRWGFSDGDRVAIHSDGGTVDLQVAVAGNMAPGVVVLPRHRKLPWQYLGGSKIMLQKDRIFKTNEDA